MVGHFMGWQSRVKTDLLKANAWAKAQNVLTFLGEFGVYSKATFKDKVKWTHCVRQQTEQLGAPGPTGNSEPASEFMIEKTEGGELNC